MNFSLVSLFRLTTVHGLLKTCAIGSRIFRIGVSFRRQIGPHWHTDVINMKCTEKPDQMQSNENKHSSNIYKAVHGSN